MAILKFLSLFQGGQGRDWERDNIDALFGVKGKERDTE